MSTPHTVDKMETVDMVHARNRLEVGAENGCDTLVNFYWEVSSGGCSRSGIFRL